MVALERLWREKFTVAPPLPGWWPVSCERSLAVGEEVAPARRRRLHRRRHLRHPRRSPAAKTDDCDHDEVWVTTSTWPLCRA